MSINWVDFDRENALLVATPETDRIDLGQFEELVEELTSRRRFDGTFQVILDMQHVSYLTSPCLGALIEFQQDMKENRGTVVLAGCQPEVAFLFKTTKLDTVLTLFDDVEEARDSFDAATFLGDRK